MNLQFDHTRHVNRAAGPVFMSASFVVEWARVAQPGDELTYFTGVCLATERLGNKVLDHAATVICELDAEGAVCALQKRDGAFKTRYFIRKVSKCFSTIHQ